ncbi:MAG: proton-conducting transporter membrane subunit [Acidobacteriaceae bacterium]
MIPSLFKSFLLLVLCIPAALIAIGGSNRGRRLYSLLLFVFAILGTVISYLCWVRGIRLELKLESFAPLPFALQLDGLSAFFLFLMCLVAVPVFLFSGRYIERHYQASRQVWLWVLLPWFLLSMIIVVTASTAFAFLFGWEFMTLLSAGLVIVDGDSKERRHNLWIYLLMMHAGAGCVFAAFMLFLPQAVSLDFAGMRTAAATMSPGLRSAVFVLAFLGFGTKAGIVPLHIWLPKTHPIAPSPVSALMSAVMLKTAVYGFVRFGFDILGTGPGWWGVLVLLTGGLTGLIGVLFAIQENDLKRLLAYSSVENIGIIYLGIGASLLLVAHGSLEWAALSLCAALLHSLNHALFKSLLFLGAGAISDAAHTLDLDELGGLLKHMPVAGIALLIACCSIIGLPLSNGFISEWLTFQGFLAGAALTSVSASLLLPIMIGVLALIGGLAATCFVKVYGTAFLGRPRSVEAETAHDVPLSMRAALLVLAAACLAIGVFPGIVLQPLSANAAGLLHASALPPMIASLGSVMPWIALIVVLVASALMLFRRTRRTTPTWACGLPGLDNRMQYTGTSFSKPVRRVFAKAYRPERSVEVIPEDQSYFPTAISYRSVRTTSFERSLYRPAVDGIISVGHRLRRLQTGNIQIYLLYVFLALIGVLLFMRFA